MPGSLELGTLFFSLFVGFFSGAFGVGGGFAFFPYLNLVHHLDASSSAATSTGQIPFTSASATWAHYKNKLLSINFPLLFGTVIGSIGSALLLWFYGKTGSVKWLIVGLYVTINFSSGLLVLLHKDPTKNTSKSEYPQYKSITKAVNFKESPIKEPFCWGILSGFLSNIIGIGGGTFLVPYAIIRLNLSAKSAIAQSTLIMFVFTTFTLILYQLLSVGQPGRELLKLEILVWMVPGTVCGAWLGAHLVSKLKSSNIKKLFGGFQILLAFSYGLKILLF